MATSGTGAIATFGDMAYITGVTISGTYDSNQCIKYSDIWVSNTVLVTMSAQITGTSYTRIYMSFDGADISVGLPAPVYVEVYCRNSSSGAAVSKSITIAEGTSNGAPGMISLGGTYDLIHYMHAYWDSSSGSTSKVVEDSANRTATNWILLTAII